MSAFLLKVVVPLVLGALVVAAGLAVASALHPPMVPCASVYSPDGKVLDVTHLWCQAPAGVTP